VLIPVHFSLKIAIAWNGLHAFFTPSVDQTINCLDAFN
jgi:hypothetical protein